MVVRKTSPSRIVSLPDHLIDMLNVLTALARRLGEIGCAKACRAIAKPCSASAGGADRLSAMSCGTLAAVIGPSREGVRAIGAWFLVLVLIVVLRGLGFIVVP